MFGKKNKKKELDLEELSRVQNQSPYPPQNGVPPQVDPNLQGGYYPYGQPQPNYNQQPYQQQVPPPEEQKPQETKKPKKVKKDKTEEEIFKSKLHKRYALRGVLIFLNLALVGYLVYEVSMSVKTFVNDQNMQKENYINLCGLSKKESDELYEKYALNGYREVNDYAIIGNRLFLSETHIDATNLSTLSTLKLAQVDEEIINTGVPFSPALEFNLTTSSNVNLGIDLFSSALIDGDYLIYNSTSDGDYPIKVANMDIDTSIYTLPLENGNRRQVRIRNTKESKATVLQVRDVSSVPHDYYDLVVATQQDDDVTIPQSIRDKYKVKVCSGSDYLTCTYETKATKAILLGGTSDIKSSFDVITNTSSYFYSYVSSTTITSGRLLGLDDNDFIRESSGYVQMAGMCYSTSNCILSEVLTSEHIGKMSYVTSKEALTDADYDEILK